MDKLEFKLEDFEDYLSTVETESMREWYRKNYFPDMIQKAEHSNYSRLILEGLKNYRARFPAAFKHREG